MELHKGRTAMTDEEFKKYCSDEDTLKWKQESVEHLVRDEWIDFRRVKYRFPDGSEYEPFYNYSRKSYVVIVASDTEGNYLCVRQYRHGIGEVTTEFPAGGINLDGTEGYVTKSEKDSRRAETPLEAAKRELQEETGCVSDEWRHLITIPSNATISDNYAYIYEARNCRTASSQKLDETEFLNVRKLSAEDIEDLIRRNAFQQAVHVMAWLLSRR